MDKMIKLANEIRAGVEDVAIKAQQRIVELETNCAYYKSEAERHNAAANDLAQRLAHWIEKHDKETLARADYETKLSAVMPADFKDWHENNRSEWPDIAAWVITNLREQRADLEAEIAGLHTTMMAAAVEIQEQWEHHCDEEGYGPANLMHRLERGINGQYGYDAKTIVRMDKRIEDLEAENAKLRQALQDMVGTFCWGDMNAGEYGAIEAARAALGETK